MRVVLDTNVLVSGLLSPQGAPGRVVDLLLTGEITPLVDDRILSEYRDVLPRPKFDLPAAGISGMLEFLESECEIIPSAPVGIALPDPDDLPFLEVAISGHAESLITGNLRHFPAAIRRSLTFPIQAPAEFLRNWSSS
ncbi:MAG: putative toxin-antitoxin system toxin component, PIN family [Thermoanaerobaculia bacterium]